MVVVPLLKRCRCRTDVDHVVAGAFNDDLHFVDGAFCQALPVERADILSSLAVAKLCCGVVILWRVADAVVVALNDGCYIWSAAVAELNGVRVEHFP